MQVVITAVGPDNVGLADPIVHYVTGQGASIAEIQMYDHDEAALFAMLLRIHIQGRDLAGLRTDLTKIGAHKGLSVRVWSPEERQSKPQIAICTTFRPEPPLALLRAIRDGQVHGEAVVMIGNRDACRGIAEQFGVPWRNLAAPSGEPDNATFESILDEFQVDYVILARYMRILPPELCWKFAGGRIINLHHGLLPSFPGPRPYNDAFRGRMLTYGATCHFIVPELDAGNQTIYQSTFTVPPGAKLDEIIRIGQEDNEPRCLVEGVRRVVNREVQLHFHKVIARQEG